MILLEIKFDYDSYLWRIKSISNKAPSKRVIFI